MMFEPDRKNVILRRNQVESQTGLARSTIYKCIEDGLITRPVSINGSAVGWPAYEIDCLVSARIAGMSDDQIRDLVKQLERERHLNAPEANAVYMRAKRQLKEGNTL